LEKKHHAMARRHRRIVIRINQHISKLRKEISELEREIMILRLKARKHIERAVHNERESELAHRRARKLKQLAIKFHNFELVEEGKVRIHRKKWHFWLMKWKSTFHKRLHRPKHIIRRI